MVEESGSDVVKVSKEGEEAAPQLVVPDLFEKGNIYIKLTCKIDWCN